MSIQNWQQKNDKIRADYLAAKKANPKTFEASLNLSWSNWGFGMEPLATSVKRLADNGIRYIELHGKPDPKALDDLVRKTAECWREREAVVRSL